MTRRTKHLFLYLWPLALAGCGASDPAAAEHPLRAFAGDVLRQWLAAFLF